MWFVFSTYCHQVWSVPQVFWLGYLKPLLKMLYHDIQLANEPCKLDLLDLEERSSQLVRNLSSCEKKAWKKIQAWTGFEPMTSVMLLQCCRSHHRGHGFKSRSSLSVNIFFQAFFSQLLKLCTNREDLSSTSRSWHKICTALRTLSVLFNWLNVCPIRKSFILQWID